MKVFKFLLSMSCLIMGLLTFSMARASAEPSAESFPEETLTASAKKNSCEKVRKAQQKKCAGQIGCTIDQCDENNPKLWREIQANGSSGYKRCVDPKTGKTDPSIKPTRGQINCSEKEDDSTGCEKARKAQKAECEGLVGCSVDQCDENNPKLWRDVQINASTGYKKCVDPKTGKTNPDIESTRGKIDCSEKNDDNTDCEKVREAQKMECAGRIGCSVDQCDESNPKLWNEVQANGSTGFKKCVNPKTGKTNPNIESTRGKIDCSEK